MIFAKPVRMPLQTGATAFKTAVMIVLVFGFVWAIFPIFIIGLMVGDARKRRASDILFEKDGYRVLGGRQNRHGEAWGDIKPDTVWVQPTSELFMKVNDNPAQYIYRLTIDDLVIAESGDPDEIASLETVRRALMEGAAAARPTAAATKPPGVPTVEVESCPQCGAPLVPGATAEVTCAYCGAKAPLPEKLRDTVQLANEADRAHAHIEVSVSRTLRRGGAATTNWLITGFAVTAALALVGVIVTSLHGGRPAQLAILMVPLAFGAGAQLLIARRRALRALTLGCAAMTSLDPSHAPMCRRCRAPLPASDDPLRIIVTCVYCQTKNILGLPLGIAEETVQANDEIESVIEDQRSTSRICIAVLAAAGCGFVAGVIMLLLHR